MALLGLISLAQIWFIPGYLLLYRIHDVSRLDKILLAVPVSAVINFFLVYVLTLLNVYTQQAVIAIFCIEIIALAYFSWNKSKQPEQTHLASQVRINFDIDFTNCVFVIFILIYIDQAFNQIGTVFTQADAVISWNAWAVSWFNGIIPHNIAWYPQLLPTLYSLTYQFIANSRVELFAKLAVSFYPLVALGIIVRMSSLLPAERKKILWSGIIFFLLVRRLWGGESTVNGYADFPLAFFSLSILYVFILKAAEQSRNVPVSSITLAVVLVFITIGTSLIKQSGVYLGMLVPFIWLVYFRNGRVPQIHFKQSATIGFAIALGSATWYLFQLWRISNGQESSNLGQLSGLLQMTWYESMAFGFNILTHKLSWLWVPLFLASLWHDKVRMMTLLVVLPYMLLWAAFVPYDFRNLAPVFPMLAISLVYGCSELTSTIGNRLSPRIDRRILQRGITLTILLMLALALSNPGYNNDLLKLSDAAKNQIGDPEINSRLLAYFEFHPEPARVATPYNEMGNIPSLGERFSPISCGSEVHEKDSSLLKAITLALNDPAIHHVMLLPWCNTSVLDYFAHQPDKYHAVFRISDAVFYEIIARQK